ncbi:phage tail sheath subtilisin-like domain-containing protein [Magnetococcus sp. PR-3]|uniref:phage tail sheath subtilisin-like domain-containing protein n=1 Tax=Magnetococcus sp. PR-3 TaxID=3120355 RepID=UPI002FCE0623
MSGLDLVTLNSLPGSTRVPGLYVEVTSRGYQGSAQLERRVLLCGHRLTTGTQAAETPVMVTRAEQAKAYFGIGSQLANMVAATLAAQPGCEVWAIALDDAVGSAAATGTITLTGSATSNGTLHLYVDGLPLRVGVRTGDDTTTMASAIVAACAAQPDLGITATSALGVVTLEAKWAGSTGNDIPIMHNHHMGQDETAPAGVTVAITDMSGGATDPDTGDVVASMGNQLYSTWISGWSDSANWAQVEAELADRWGAVKRNEGVGFAGLADTHAGLVTAGSGRNNPYTSLIGAKGSPTPPWIWAAVTGATLEGWSANDPGRPVEGLDLPGVVAPKLTDRWQFEEANILLHNGISTYRVARDGTVVLERVITTYSETSQGVPDDSWLDINRPYQLMVILAEVRNWWTKFQGYKIADDGQSMSGPNITTPLAIRADLLALCSRMEAAGLVTDLEGWRDEVLVARSVSDPTAVHVVLPPKMVSPLYQMHMSIEFFI